MLAHQTQRITEISDIVGGTSLNLEGKVSVIRPEQFSIPDNVRSIHWHGGQPRSFNTPEQTLQAYTGEFQLHRRLPKDPSFPVYETNLRGDSALKTCVDYRITSKRGEMILVFGTDGPLQAVDGRSEARVLYLGDVSDDVLGPRQDAHSYRLHTNERVIVRIEPSQ